MAVRYSDGPNGLQIDPNGPYTLAQSYARDHGMEIQDKPGLHGELTTAVDSKGRFYMKPQPRKNDTKVRLRTDIVKEYNQMMMKESKPTVAQGNYTWPILLLIVGIVTVAYIGAK